MMLLNCDLGESYGNWTMGVDASVIPHIDQANIACGFHAGDPLTMRHTLCLAAEHGVAIGAHPGYPDLVGFGRRRMQLSHEEISANLLYQVAALDGMAQSMGLTLSYVKPHGALYHDMMTNIEVRGVILQAVAGYHRHLQLVVQSTEQANEHSKEADEVGVELLFEAFADRRYDDDGSLLQRSQSGAVLSREEMLQQVTQLNRDKSVTTASGNSISLQVDTLCVHGDNLKGVHAIEAIRALVNGG
jgi:UPF0271 protein